MIEQLMNGICRVLATCAGILLLAFTVPLGLIALTGLAMALCGAVALLAVLVLAVVGVLLSAGLIAPKSTGETLVKWKRGAAPSTATNN